jgi:hypothetical protein
MTYEYFVSFFKEPSVFGQTKIVLDAPITSMAQINGVRDIIACEQPNHESKLAVVILNYMLLKKHKQ